MLGAAAAELFRDEPGGHRWQRVPETERRGRVQTSTVTVAVLPEPTDAEVRLSERDIEVSTTRGSGPGGQNRNKVETCVIVKHLPTGLTVRAESERSQHQNRATAMALLRARLQAAERERIVGDRAEQRRQMLGSGQRGDKRRTIRVQDGTVHDHVTGRRWQFKQYERGEW